MTIRFPDDDCYAPDGTPREAVTDARLQEVGEAVRRIASGLQFAWPGDAQALHDIADYLVGSYGDPGTYWPQRLPIQVPPRPDAEYAAALGLVDGRYCPDHDIDLVPSDRTVGTRRYCPQCPTGSTLGFPQWMTS